MFQTSKYIYIYIYIYCENLRCVGLLGNSQACLATSSADFGMLCNVLGMLCNVISFTAYKAASGGGFFDVGPLEPCKKACRERRGRYKHAQDVEKHAQDIAKQAEDGRGRCQACLGVAKQVYTSQVLTYIYIFIIIIRYITQE